VFAVHRISQAPARRVLAAVRDDDRRVGVIGLDPYRFRLPAVVVSAAMAAAAGVVYLLLVGGASPHVGRVGPHLSLLVMVVLGGMGTRWGPLMGGIAFAFLVHRLTAVGSSHAVSAPKSVDLGHSDAIRDQLTSLCPRSARWAGGGVVRKVDR
jgi:branched-chain amino acid transport system permease protein